MPRIVTAVAGLALVVAVALMPMPVVAQSAVTFRYFYDETGQLTRVVDSTGIVIEYVYDAVGNMLEIKRSTVSPTQLSIVGFSPSQGGPRNIVTIQGIGFSTQAAQNSVSFNGVLAPVQSATANSLVVTVPDAATSGLVTVTVGSSSASSATQFTVLAQPVITSISPPVVDSARPPASVKVTGINLAGAQFMAIPAFEPRQVTFGTAQVNPAGTVADVPITVLPNSRGTFVVVATAAAGTSDTVASAGNTLSVIGAGDEVDSDGDGFPDGLELLYGSDPNLAASVPDFTRSGDLTAAVSVVNKTFPAAFEKSSVQWFIVRNTTFPAGMEKSSIQWFSVLNALQTPQTQTLVSPSVSVRNLTPEEAATQQALAAAAQQARQLGGGGPLGISLDGVGTARRLIAGQTVVVGANVSGGDGGGTVSFSVNGTTFATDGTPPYAMTFTVPWGVSELTFAGVVRESNGQTANATSLTVSVDPDPGASVSGRVVDAQGNPVVKARIELVSEGLHAELFDAAPLDALPDLAGATPARSTRVTAINTRGPLGLFGPDPLGTGLAPDYAARFTGWLWVQTAGSHTLFLGADEGARLKVGGVTVVDMPAPAPGGFQESSGTIELPAGLVPIEITFYESTGNAELQLSFMPPGGERQVVPPSALVAVGAPFVVVTDGNGRFALQGVPTALGNAGVRVTSPDGNVVVAAPVAGPLSVDGVDVGDVVLPVTP